MEYIRQVVAGDELVGIIDIPQAFRRRKAEIIVLFTNEYVDEAHQSNKRSIGFAKGAEVPDSFFEPLPEEELQLWGL